MNEKYINNLRYADDTALISDNIEDLQNLVNTIKDAGMQCGLVINVKKTEFMVVSTETHPDTALRIGEDCIQRVTSFKYCNVLGIPYKERTNFCG